MKNINEADLSGQHKLSILVPFNGAMGMLSKLYLSKVLDTWYVKITPPHAGAIAMDFIGVDNLLDLFHALIEFKPMFMMWTTNKYGYQVSLDGTILETWELEDGCI
jgi:hypothetical protein